MIAAVVVIELIVEVAVIELMVEVELIVVTRSRAIGGLLVE